VPGPSGSDLAGRRSSNGTQVSRFRRAGATIAALGVMLVPAALHDPGGPAVLPLGAQDSIALRMPGTGDALGLLRLERGGREALGVTGRLPDGSGLLDLPDDLLGGSLVETGEQLGIPAIVLDAYQRAERSVAVTHPQCGLKWWILAGIGRIESNHARGGKVDANGTTVTPILGPQLSGGPGIAAIRDTDGGRLDGDSAWDRAVGPMQFIPSTWARYGVDGNGDGVANPHNVYDAALAAAHYLCAGGADLRDPAQLAAAIFRYNHSQSYVRAVLSWAQRYASGVTELPVPPQEGQPVLPGEVPWVPPGGPTNPPPQPPPPGEPDPEQPVPGAPGGTPPVSETPTQEPTPTPSVPPTGTTPPCPSGTTSPSTTPSGPSTSPSTWPTTSPSGPSTPSTTPSAPSTTPSTPPSSDPCAPPTSSPSDVPPTTTSGAEPTTTTPGGAVPTPSLTSTAVPTSTTGVHPTSVTTTSRTTVLPPTSTTMEPPAPPTEPCGVDPTGSTDPDAPEESAEGGAEPTVTGAPSAPEEPEEAGEPPEETPDGSCRTTTPSVTPTDSSTPTSAG